MLGAGGAVYQFYFKEQVDRYNANAIYLKSIENKRADLDRKFNGKKPDEMVARYRQLVNPWIDAAESRARIFNIEDYTKVDPVPEGVLARPYYIEHVEGMKNQLLTDAYNAGVALVNVDTYFGRPTPADLSSTTITANDATNWLSEVQLGSSIIRLLISKGAIQINNFDMWPEELKAEIFLRRTFGVDMWIRMSNFCKLVQDLQYDDRTFFTVASFRLQNPQLRSYDPPLHVELIITMADYKPPKELQKATETGGASVASNGASQLDQALDRVQQTRLNRESETQNSTE